MPSAFLSIHAQTEKPPGFPIAILHGTGTQNDKLVFLDPAAESGTEIKADEGIKLAIEPTHDPKGRDVIMVGGKSGSGKSHIARNFIVRYNNLHPDRKIYLLSFLDGDTTLGSVKGLYRKIKKEKLEDEYAEFSIKDFENALVVVDDVEGFERTNKMVFQKIQSIIDMIATMGRHTASSILVCSHLLTDYKRTRLFLGEAQQFVTFMHGASQRQLYGLLGGYAGIDHSEIDDLRKLNSRWVCVRTQYPVMAIYEKGAHLLRQNDEPAPKKTRIVDVEPISV
jgi:hypothetical protein